MTPLTPISKPITISRAPMKRPNSVSNNIQLADYFPNATINSPKINNNLPISTPNTLNDFFPDAPIKENTYKTPFNSVIARSNLTDDLVNEIIA